MSTTRKRNTEDKKNNYGLTVSGKIRVFSRVREVKKYQFTDYTITISKKNAETGEYTNLYLPVFFGRDAEKPENNSVIDITSSRLFVSGNAGYEKIGLFVETWDYAED